MKAYYSLDSSPLAWVELPVAPRFGSDFVSEHDEVITHRTDGGQLWKYLTFSEEGPWELDFRFNNTERLAFRALHEAVGQEAFYFRIGEDSTYQIYGYKEDGFKPRMLTNPTNPWMFDYHMTITKKIIPEEF